MFNSTSAVSGHGEEDPPSLSRICSAPELISNARATSGASDVYSLGALLAAAVIGPSVLTASDRTLHDTVVDGFADLGTRVEESFLDVVLKAVSADRERRFENPAAMRAALRACGSVADLRMAIADLSDALALPNRDIAAVAQRHPAVVQPGSGNLVDSEADTPRDADDLGWIPVRIEATPSAPEAFEPDDTTAPGVGTTPAKDFGKIRLLSRDVDPTVMGEDEHSTADLPTADVETADVECATADLERAEGATADVEAFDLVAEEEPAVGPDPADADDSGDDQPRSAEAPEPPPQSFEQGQTKYESVPPHARDLLDAPPKSFEHPDTKFEPAPPGASAEPEPPDEDRHPSDDAAVRPSSPPPSEFADTSDRSTQIADPSMTPTPPDGIEEAAFGDTSPDSPVPDEMQAAQSDSSTSSAAWKPSSSN